MGVDAEVTWAFLSSGGFIKASPDCSEWDGSLGVLFGYERKG